MVFGILVALWKKKLDRAGINKKYGGYDAAYYLETSIISDSFGFSRGDGDGDRSIHERPGTGVKAGSISRLELG